MEELLVKTYTAGDDLAAARFAKFTGSGADVVVEHATGGNKVIGITTRTPATVDDGDPVDVVHVGITDLELVGSVSAGDRLAASTNGKGIASTSEVPGVVGAFALQDGVSGDIIRVVLK